MTGTPELLLGYGAPPAAAVRPGGDAPDPGSGRRRAAADASGATPDAPVAGRRGPDAGPAVLGGLGAVDLRGALDVVTSGARAAAALVVRPGAVAGRGLRLAGSLAGIVASPAGGPLRSLSRASAAARDAALGLVEDAELPGADRARLRAAVDRVSVLLLADAPRNRPAPDGPSSRDVWAEATSRRTGSTPGSTRPSSNGAPARATEAPAGFGGGARRPDPTVGVDVAASSGAVVLRTPEFELVQYLPRSERVHDRPVLVVPSPLGRPWIADLAPRRSLVEHHVGAGLQVFLLSWRQVPSSGPGLDAHAAAVLEALDACERITRAGAAALVGLGEGGTVAALLLAHLAATGTAQERVSSLTLVDSVLDHAALPRDPEAARAAVAASRARGHLVVTPGGPERPADVGFWSRSAVRVPAALHADLLELGLGAGPGTAGAVTVLGTPVDLTRIDRDCYVVAHDPHRAARAAASTLLGGPVRLVGPSGSGPVDPPDEVGAEHRRVDLAPGAPIAGPALDAVVAAATPVPGSWWADHARWLAERSGELRDAPPETGGRGLHPLTPAPGDYALER